MYALLILKLGADHALDVVAAADAVDVGVAAVRHDGVRVGRRDHHDADFLVDLRGGDRHAGIQVTDDGHDVLVGDDVLGVGDADVGLGLIVEGHELDLVAHLLEIALQLLDGELGAELDAFAQSGLAA